MGTAISKSACVLHRDRILERARQKVSLEAIAQEVGTNRRHIRKLLARERVTRFRLSAKGSDNPNWKGGRIVDAAGYVWVYRPGRGSARLPNHVQEHRLVMETYLGRRLKKTEVVHHENKNKLDNRIENLILFRRNGEHLARELKGKCPRWTPDGLERIRQGVIQSAIVRRKHSQKV